MKPSPLNPAAEEQAALWAARLDGSELSAADQAELKTWLGADAGHRALLSQYCQFSADLEEQLPALVASGAVKMPQPAAVERPRFWRGWFAGIAVAAAAALAVVFWVAKPGAATGPLNFASAVAARSAIDLPDGSHVELNAHTRLAFENTGSERHVRLAGGEAFFKVAKDKAHPFIVTTDAGTVRVTGTQFNVRSETAGELEVTVAEGSVQVRPNEASTREPFNLTVGDQLRAESGGTVTTAHLAAEALDAALAWRRGEIVAADESKGIRVDAALERYSRYQGRALKAEGSIASYPVGGRISLDDLESFLEVLKRNAGAEVVYQPDGTVVVRRRGEK